MIGASFLYIAVCMSLIGGCEAFFMACVGSISDRLGISLLMDV